MLVRMLGTSNPKLESSFIFGFNSNGTPSTSENWESVPLFLFWQLLTSKLSWIGGGGLAGAGRNGGYDKRFWPLFGGEGAARDGDI
jgi:hypothetical protein